jgi:hypothetical protein
MATVPEELWTGFNNRKLAAERAKKDWNGRLLTSINSANDSTITVKVADASTGPTAGTFTTNQASAGTITIPAAVSAPSGGSATPGVMSVADKEKLDGISAGANKVTDSTNWGWIKIDGVDTEIYRHPTPASDPTQSTAGLYKITVERDGHVTSTAAASASDVGITVDATNGVTDTVNSVTYKYTHPSAGPASTTSVGDTTAQTPAFGGFFMVTSETVDTDGHTTAVAAHRVTIPSATAVAPSGGDAGSAGLMSAADKEKIDALPSSVGDGTLSITVGSNAAVTFSANQAGNETVSIPNAASASGGSAATGGLMTATDKANLDNATAVIPSTATDQNLLVTQTDLSTAISDFGGFKTANGTGADNHPDVASPDTHFIYLVKDNSTTGDDKYKEWICTDTTANPPTWELIGDTSMDMSGYVELPSTHTDTHIVVFGPNDDIVDSNKTISDLENVVETISVGGGTGISPPSGTKNIDIPLASSSPTGTGTAGAMSGADKIKLDGITDYLVSASVSNGTLTLTPNTGSAVTFSGDENVIESISVNNSPLTPDANKNVDITVPTAAASTDTPAMDASTAAVGTSTAYARADHVHPSDTSKADKAVPTQSGNLASLDASGNLQDAGVAISGLKTVQTAVADGDATTAGTGVTFVDSVTQNTNGVISVHKKTVQTVQKSTSAVGGQDGLMTAQQAEALYDLNTWTYDTFGDNGPTGTDTSDVFPRASS